MTKHKGIPILYKHLRVLLIISIPITIIFCYAYVIYQKGYDNGELAQNQIDPIFLATTTFDVFTYGTTTVPTKPL